MSETPILSINNIEALYGGVIQALNGVTLNVNEGEIVSLLGANGAGKTTTLKACSRLLEAERGEVTKGVIELNGEDIAQFNGYEMVKQGVVQVLEGRHIFAHLNVEENLLTGSFIQNMSKAETNRNLEYVYAGNYDGISPYHNGDDHPNTTGNLKATTEFLPILNYYYIN